METVLKRLGIIKDETAEDFSMVSTIMMILIFLGFSASVMYVLINSAA